MLLRFVVLHLDQRFDFRGIRRLPGAVNDFIPLGSCRVEFTEKFGNRVAAFRDVLCKSFFDQIDFLCFRELAQFLPDDRRVALDQLFGSKIDQIVQHAPTQGDLTYCDQMVVKERQFEGFPTLRFLVLLGEFALVTSVGENGRRELVFRGNGVLI
jgi:hypothetical protein